jgi:hypothetical protein
MIEKWELLGYIKQIYHYKDRKDTELESKKRGYIETLEVEKSDFETEIKGTEDNVVKLHLLQDERK